MKGLHMSQRSRTVRSAGAMGAALGATILSGCLSMMPILAPEAENVEEGISAAFPYEYRFIEVKGSRMAYVEAGDPNGPPILLVHGNPTSAYLWRNVIPQLEAQGRVIAVDLIGMGKSDKPEIDYRFADQAAYLAGFIEAMKLEGLFLVLHDWGGGVGIDYAARHPENVRGIAMFEMAIKPMSLKDADLATEYLFGRMREKEDGDALLIKDNFFVEVLLPMMSGRELSTKEMAYYRAPYKTEKSRKPVRQWPLEIPLDGVPKDNTERIGANYRWLISSDVPLFMLYADPGMIWTKKTRPSLFKELPRMKTALIGSGLHYLQEVQPTRLGTLIADWIGTLRARSAVAKPSGKH